MVKVACDEADWDAVILRLPAVMARSMDFFSAPNTSSAVVKPDTPATVAVLFAEVTEVLNVIVCVAFFESSMIVVRPFREVTFATVMVAAAPDAFWLIVLSKVTV